VREYLPDFQMFDPFATAEMTLEDMMCHRSGLPYHENLLATGVGKELTGSPRAWREELLKRLRYFEPSHPFRTHFQYQDIVFTAAGGVLEHIMDAEYEKLMTERLLGPLGMVQSTYSRPEAKASGRLAKSYAIVDGEVQAMDFIDVSYLAPTAGLYSTAVEMIRWVQFHLDDGWVEDHQLVSKESMDWVHSPHMVVDDPWALEHFQSTDVTYGLGWFRATHRGRLLISHGGSFNGHRTNISYMPELNTGVVVMCNLNLTSFPGLIFRIIYDRLLGFDDAKKWDSIFRAMDQAQRKMTQEEEKQFLEARQPEKKPQYTLADYTGTYTHPGYGAFEVALAEDGLIQTYEERSFALETYDGETFATRFQSTENNLLHLTMTFEPDPEGHVEAAIIPLIPGIPAQRFMRE
jgi:CubicO group peptidase (beta-lactamase class C family)